MKKVMLVDDGDAIYTHLQKLLKQNGFEVSTVSSDGEAVDWLKSKKVDVVICNSDSPTQMGAGLLQKVKAINSSVEVIVVSTHPTVKAAVDAMRKGAFDYLTKPLYPDEILAIVKEATEKGQERIVEKRNARTKPRKAVLDRIVGPSYQSQMVEKHVDMIAPTNMSVIICGETGTGKEYVARSIHNKSRRSNRKFVAVDCGAIPRELAGSELFGHVKGAFTGAIADKKGCFEQANRGTLFLDEIGNLSYEHQVQLLRVLQEKTVRRIGGSQEIPVDIRLLVATNEDLVEAVDKGDFRDDIFYRLNEFKIELVPLHERPDDIPVFARHFLNQANRQLGKNIAGFDSNVLERFASYRWHGNLRELRNVIKRSVLVCKKETIGTSDLPDDLSNAETHAAFPGGSLQSNNGQVSLKEVAWRAEKKAIMEVLRRTDHNKSKAATILGVDRKTLYNKMKTYGIDG